MAGIGAVSIRIGSLPRARTRGTAHADVRPEARGRLLARDEHRGRAVGDLRRVAGGDDAVGLERRLERREALGVVSGRMPSSTVITSVAPSTLTGTGTISRSNRPSSVACAARWCELERERVELLARERPLLGDQLGRDALRHEVGIPLVQPRRRTGRLPSDRRAHRHAAHALDAGRDHDVVRARDHTLRGEVDRLLRRAALPVDRRAGHGVGEAGREQRRCGRCSAPARRPA